METEPGGPRDVVALGVGHDHEPGAPGPVRVVVVIELVSITSLLQNFADSALRMISGRIEENKAWIEILEADVSVGCSSTSTATSATMSITSASSRQNSSTSRLTRGWGTTFCHLLIDVPALSVSSVLNNLCQNIF